MKNVFFIALATVTLAVTPSFGGSLAASATGGVLSANFHFTVGWSFTVNSAVTVEALAFFDAGNDGLHDAHDIAIWRSDTTLVTSTTIPAGTSAVLDSGYREVAISPVLLNPGDYVIGAYLPLAVDTWHFGSGTVVTTIPQITFGHDQFVAGTSLAFPNSSNLNPGYFGPSFFVQDAVPEPSAGVLGLTGLGLVMAGLIRRRRPAGFACPGK